MHAKYHTQTPFRGLFRGSGGVIGHIWSACRTRQARENSLKRPSAKADSRISHSAPKACSKDLSRLPPPVDHSLSPPSTFPTKIPFQLTHIQNGFRKGPRQVRQGHPCSRQDWYVSPRNLSRFLSAHNTRIETARAEKMGSAETMGLTCVV